MILQCPDGCGSGLLGWIQESKVAQKHHIAFLLGAEGIHRGRIAFLCNGQHPEAFVIESVHRLQNLPPYFLRQRQHLTAALRKSTDGQHLLHRALDYHLSFPCSVLHHRGQAPPGKIEGSFIHLGILPGQFCQCWIFRLFSFNPADNGQIHQILITGLEIAVQIGVAKDPAVVLPVDIQVIFQHNLVLGQGSGFVRAEDIHGPEILDGVQILDNGLLLAHRHCTFGKAGGHNHGQHFGGQPHRNGNAEQEGIETVPLGDAVEEKYQRNHYQHKPDQNPGNCVDSLGKAGLHRLTCNGSCHGTEKRMIPHAHRNGNGTSGNHIAAHKRNIGILRHAVLWVVHMGRFLHRLALPREPGLADEKVFCFQNPQSPAHRCTRSPTTSSSMGISVFS